MPESWWASILQAKISQGDVFRELVWGGSPPSVSYLKKISQAGKRAWQESDTFEADNDGLGFFLARGRIVPCIVLSHDCTIENDNERAKIVIAPMFRGAT